MKGQPDTLPIIHFCTTYMFLFLESKLNLNENKIKFSFHEELYSAINLLSKCRQYYLIKNTFIHDTRHTQGQIFFTQDDIQ